MPRRRRLHRVEVVELDERARRVLARRHPEVTGYGTAFLVSAAPEVRDALRKAIETLAEAANAGEQLRTERLVESLLPPVDVPTPPMLERARQEAQFRLRV